MDLLSGTTPVATQIDVIVKTFRLIKSLTQSYRNAPAEIEDLRHRLEALNNHLILLRDVQQTVSTNRVALDLDSAKFDTLKRSLNETRIIFTDVQRFLEQKTLKNSHSARMKWVLSDSSKVKVWELRLRRHEDLLQTTLILLNSLFSNLFECEFVAVKDTLKLQTHQLNSILSKNTARFSWARSISGSDWVLPYIARINGSICCSEDLEQQSYGISLRLQALFCLKVFCMELRLNRGSLFSFEVSAIGTGVVLKNVVPPDSMIMTACESGNTSLVWSLLNEGKASINDITPDNFSPLSHAIAGGSLEVLSLLVSKGADIRKSFGRFQTGPLDWALAHRQYSAARWLVAHKVDVHHISARGWTPAFSLFGEESCHVDSCEDFLTLLSTASFGDFNAQDQAGWTIMHRAAVFGNADHIKSLSLRNTSLHLPTSVLGWTPIFSAVHFGNSSTFMELIQQQPQFLYATDRRQWTLLHVAVNAKRLDIMATLIALGADPHAVSFPTTSFIAKDLSGFLLTPGDIARIRGPSVFTAYLDVLKANDYKIYVISNEKDEGELDLFWPATE